MYKRLVSVVAAVCIMLSASLNAFAFPAFVSDIPLPDWNTGEYDDDAPWYSQAVYNLWYAHVADRLTEELDGLAFEPERVVKREQFITALGHLAHECGKVIERTAANRDLTAADCIKWAVENHILYGRETGLAREDAMTRQEMAVFLIRFANYMELPISDRDEESTYARFQDSDAVASWAESAMKEACCLKLMAGEKGRDETYFLRPLPALKLPRP